MNNPQDLHEETVAETIDIKNVRLDVNAVIDTYYKNRRERARTLSPDYDYLWEALSLQNQAAGKRLRPYLCILAYQALGGTDYDATLPIAASIELLHSAMLIHDDIIDRDYVRRNKPNVAGIYLTKYDTHIHDSVEKYHFANMAALLAGDIVLSDAYQMILDSTVSDTFKVQLCKLLGEAVFTLVGGELLDSEASLYPIDHADSIKIAEYKTALYSFSTPLLAGGLLAGATESQQEHLKQFGVKLGIAFQLADDILGVFGDADQTGKSTIGDIREGKRTYLLQQTLIRANHDQQQLLIATVGHPNCDELMAQQVRNIMIECGAKAEVESLMQQYATEAENMLQALNFSQEYTTQFTAFIQKAVWRKR